MNEILFFKILILFKRKLQILYFSLIFPISLMYQYLIDEEVPHIMRTI